MQKQIIHKTFVFDKNVPQLEYEKYINPEDLLDEDFENVKGEFVNYRKKTGAEILKEEYEQRKKNEQRRMTQTPTDIQPKKRIYDEQDDTKQMLAAISQKIKEEENNCKQLKKQVLLRKNINMLANFGTDFTLYKHMIQKTEMAKQIIFSEADFQLLIKKEQDDDIRVQKQQVVRKKKGFVERQAQDKGVFEKKMYKTWYKPEDTKLFKSTAATSIFKRTTSNMTKEYFFNKALEILDRYMDQLAEIEKSQDKYGLCPQDFVEYRVDSLSEAKLFKFYNICEKFALSPYHLIEYRIKSLKKAKQDGLVHIEKESHRSIDQRIETLKKVLQLLPDILKNMPIAEQKQDHQFKGLKQTNMSSYLQQVVTKPIMDEKLQLFKTPKVHGKRLIEMTTKAKHMKVQKFDFKRYVLNV